jgi:magnesium transporter
MQYVFVVDFANKLLGFIDMELLIKRSPTSTAKEIMKGQNQFLHPTDNRERIPFYSVKYDLDMIPVINSEGKFLGAVLSKTIINVMHEEHLENTLIVSGIHGKKSNIVKLATANIFNVIVSRVPWLVIGLVAGLGLGFISSLFEKALERSIVIAYFIPVVAYIADSVGTQSEAIAVRALATLKIKYPLYLLRELLIGMVLGLIMGLLGGLGAFFITHSTGVGLVVGLSLFVASTLASVLASLIPIIFKVLGRDPALGSGPLATALQDTISVLIYFLFATWLISII